MDDINNDNNNSSRSSALRVAFVHPDLGIGGAERLVVDAAVALQQCGHNVTMYTSHCDPKHSFDETQDGTLRVCVWGDWIPRHVAGMFHVVLAWLRVLWVSLWLVVLRRDLDVIVCDQVSFTVPLLRLSRAKVLFYCHFPDKLLVQTRGSRLRALYRAPVDYLEEVTTRAADMLVANSHFTASVILKHFPSIKEEPQVLFPTTTLTLAGSSAHRQMQMERLQGVRFFLSINRYEMKKDHALALEAFALVCKLDPKLVLVIAGGYDERVVENKVVHEQLAKRVTQLGLEDRVVMLRSVSQPLKMQLLLNCLAVIYTPRDEHFGIVPVEAMALGKPVVASNSGGPTETIADGVTGFLCHHEPAAFATALKRLIEEPSLAERMGSKGVDRVDMFFGFQAFKKKLDQLVRELMTKQ